MNTISKISLMLLAFTLILGGCRKDETVTSIITIPPTPEIMISSSLMGQVVDQSGVGIKDASISIENEMRITDKNGIFKFDKIQMKESGTYVKAEKAGYFLGAKMVMPRLNEQSKTKILLLEKTLQGTIEAVNGGTVTSNGNAKVILPSDGIQIDDAGGSYQGSVNVYMQWLDPTSDKIAEMTPGDLRAVNKDGDLVKLATYGMVVVELESPTGEKLNIKEGQKAIIELPVPSELLSSAPNTIPLWHFNETKGIWEEEGTATLQGDKYIGEVSHFSFWNLDVPYPLIQVSGNIVDSEGIGVSNVLMYVTVNNSPAICNYGYTDDAGNFSGLMPQNEELTIEILDNCGNTIYSDIVGPFSGDVILPTIVIDVNDDLFHFSASLLGCDGSPVSNGYLTIYTSDGDYYYLEADANGQVMGSFLNCNGATELMVVGSDLDELTYSESESYDITGLSTLDISSIDVCVIQYEGFTIHSNGAGGWAINSQDLLIQLEVNGNPGVSIQATGTNPTNPLVFELEGVTGTGAYNPTYVFVDEDLTGAGEGIFVGCEDAECSDFVVTITTFEGVGGILVGSFSGQLPDTSNGGSLIDVQGEFIGVIE